MDCEGTVIISCGTLTSEDIICKILGVETLPESIASDYAVKGYLWNCKNKYYSTKINLYALEEKTELDLSFCNNIKAVIFYFDTQKQSSFDDVASWLPYLKDIDSEVQLLLCNDCPEENSNPALERKNILKWCIENQYELVELNPVPESDDEDEQTFNCAKGFDRVIEALQSYAWADLVFEEDKPSASGKEKGNSSASNKDGCKTLKVEDLELDLEEKWLDVLRGEDPGGESFEALFAKFASMKERASGLTGDDRKKYAEKVAIAFWRATGGNEDEIEGLDDSDE
ncbi:alpha- and gamma-adaptin-binding protein p34-like isoform X1 [Argiope bruennichi]|uniref:alpha- and gamma-adaptin-binding protein p34-like isoform X1 n=1 Tax=Argiope bruennichi TaxID=94029 RepID=UPI0024945EB9|nr:alpha- and gamma-adaptin-binding protein p34-like isoform X1 [Argiope bruennichi]